MGYRIAENAPTGCESKPKGMDLEDFQDHHMAMILDDAIESTTNSPPGF